MKYESLIETQPPRPFGERVGVRGGFTLMELVVVIGIFSLLSLLIMSLHLRVSDLQKRTSEEQKVVSELRFALEAIANNLRIGTVQYKKYSNTTADGCTLTPETTGQPASQRSKLYLVDEDGEQIQYEYRAAASCPIAGTAVGCIVKKYLGQASEPLATPTQGQLTAKTLRVRDFKVYILPLCDPYNTTCSVSDKRQPIVTMVAGVDVPEKNGGYATRYVQTTVSSRVYRHIASVCN